LSDIVNDAVTSVRPILDRAGHQLETHLPRETITLDADATRLTQVLTNLLSNAVRYTPNGGRIELTVQTRDRSALITVKDNGFGMSEEVIRHAFDMFYQGDDQRGQRTGGLGIGLTLSRTLIEMHGGSISARSAGPDQGSEFTVTLPLSSDLPAE